MEDKRMVGYLDIALNEYPVRLYIEESAGLFMVTVGVAQPVEAGPMMGSEIDIAVLSEKEKPLRLLEHPSEEALIATEGQEYQTANAIFKFQSDSPKQRPKWIDYKIREYTGRLDTAGLQASD